jgi:hypothetical protein
MKRVVRIGLNHKFDLRPATLQPMAGIGTSLAIILLQHVGDVCARCGPYGTTANANERRTVGGCLEWQQIVDVQQRDPLRPWNLPMGRIVSTGKTPAVPKAKSGRIRLCGDNSTKETRANRQRRQKSVCQLQ